MPEQERESNDIDSELREVIKGLASLQPEAVQGAREYLDRYCEPRESNEVQRDQKTLVQFIELLRANFGKELGWLLQLAELVDNALCSQDPLARVHITVIQGDNVANKTEISVGSATGSTIIGIARETTSYNQYVDESQHLDGELKDSLKRAREAIDELGLPKEEQDDLADDLGRLTDELGRENPSGSRVQSLLKRIEAVAATVAAILKPVAIVKELL